MPRKLSDDEIMDYTYNKLFGDLDRIESGSMMDEDNPRQENTSGTGAPGSSGITITIEPKMAAAAEGSRPTDKDEEADEEDEDEDRLKGIGSMSPLMAQLHGSR